MSLDILLKTIGNAGLTFCFFHVSLADFGIIKLAYLIFRN